MNKAEEVKKENISLSLGATMYKSSVSLLAGLTSSGGTALKKNTWFQEISA